MRPWWALGVVLACAPPVQLLDANGAVVREYAGVEVATSPEARQRGLSGRAGLSATEALALQYPVVDEACITNGPVGFPIVALFLDAQGSVVGAERFAANEARARCHRGVLNVLETDASLPDGVTRVKGLPSAR